MGGADLAASAGRRALGAARAAGRRSIALLRRAWAARPPARRAAALLLAAGLLAAGSSGIAFQLALPARLPRAVDWAAARALLERDARPGDAVAVAPAWAERARETLPGNVPVIAAPRVEGEDLAGVRRVWLLSATGAPGFSWAPELELVRRAARSEPLPRLGALAVTRYDLAFPLLPLAFLPDRVAGATARLGEVRCAPDGAGAGGFVCDPGDGSPAVRGGRTVREVAGVPRPCLAVTLPAPAGAPLALDLPGVPIGRTLRGSAGFAPAGADPAGGGAPVRIAFRVDGQEVGATEAAGAVPARFALDTRALAGRLATVTIVLTWPAPAGTLCLDAVTTP